MVAMIGVEFPVRESEKEMTLDVAQRLSPLAAGGYRVVMTRDDVFVIGVRVAT
jgi:N-acetylmuramoyl-L-alanine amidase